VTLLEALTRIASRTNKDISNTTVKARLLGHLNDACQEKWDGFEWSFRWRDYPLVLTADVTSGTMTATNGSSTVTASGTPFVTGVHENGWIRFTEDSVSTWYRVHSVDSTATITIEPAYQGTTGANKLYELKRTDYRLPTELADVGAINITSQGKPLGVSTLGSLDLNYQPDLKRGYPTMAALFDTDFKGATYSTGTVSGSINTRSITGSGTSWRSNVSPGDTMTFASVKYTVYRVESDTSITLYQNLQATVSGASYTSVRQFGRILRLTPSADQAYVVFVRGLRRYAPLVNDNDINDFLNRYPAAVIEAAVWRELGSSPDPREASNYMKSEQMWNNAIAEDRKLTARKNQAPIWSPRNAARGWWNW
jgi:hypothetical protein